jgi:hypothetical protein
MFAMRASSVTTRGSLSRIQAVGSGHGTRDGSGPATPVRRDARVLLGENGSDLGAHSPGERCVGFCLLEDTPRVDEAGHGSAHVERPVSRLERDRGDGDRATGREEPKNPSLASHRLPSGLSVGKPGEPVTGEPNELPLFPWLHGNGAGAHVHAVALQGGTHRFGVPRHGR